MKTSIATVSISGELPEKLNAISAAGFDGIEIFEQDFITFDGRPKDVGQMVRDQGLEITLFQPFRDFEGLPEPYRSKAFDRAERKFDIMQELGADLILMCSSCHPASLGGIDRAADDFRELGDRAAKRNVRLGYEALCWGKHVNDHRDAWEIVRRTEHPNVGLILDSFHTLGRKIDTETIRSIPGDRIFFIQLADAPAINMDLLYWSRHFRNMPGEGDLDVKSFMKAVAATGYNGPISLEIFNDQFRGGSSKLVAADGYRSLIALMDDVKREQPTSLTKVPQLPKRIQPKGVSFVEFASQGEDVVNLENLMKTMGFVKNGDHRNKQVSLWQQGDIRIVINQEMSGHAAEQWNLSGTTVCDLGISVNSSKDAITRASNLGAKKFSQPLGPGELAIPAIKGLSGSVMRFIDKEDSIDRVWETEFGVEADHIGAGLKGVDHIAQTMSYDEMLSWSLFYTSLFEMKKSPMIDIFDPDGLVRSQAVEDPLGLFRVTLNGADSHRTLAGSFLAETSGASMQHIALATTDIFSSLKHMFELGFEALPISENYYEDLIARFDLPKEFVDKMQKHNVLFDRDEGGDFLQCYSQMLAGGVFFEVVQREKGYNGFGGPNAPFRISAQKRLVRKKMI